MAAAAVPRPVHGRPPTASPRRYAGAHFAGQLLKAIDGEAGITECAFVESDVTAAPYFSTPVTLGKNGVEQIHGYGTLSAFEQDVLDKAVPDLVAQAEKGIKFAGEA